MARGTSSSNARGGSEARRRRRARLIEKYGVYSANGTTLWIPCYHCGKRMRAAGRQWQVDRFPLCGHLGGTYAFNNIVASCAPCNAHRCGNQHKECSHGPKRQEKLARRGKSSRQMYDEKAYMAAREPNSNQEEAESGQADLQSHSEHLRVAEGDCIPF